MIIILAKCTVKIESIEEFLSYAKKLVVESRKEKGCISYEICQDLKNEREFVFVEKWQDEEAIVRHNNSEHFINIVPKLSEQQQCEVKVTLYEIK